MIFLVIPIVMPPLLAAVPDAAWVAALTLLVLQAGFLLPPLGYAIVDVAPNAGHAGAVRVRWPGRSCRSSRRKRSSSRC